MKLMVEGLDLVGADELFWHRVGEAGDCKAEA
jgi:hypothetical protein